MFARMYKENTAQNGELWSKPKIFLVLLCVQHEIKKVGKAAEKAQGKK